MYNFFQKDGEKFPLIGTVNYSTGDGLELSQRYGYDYSRKPQSLTYRRRNTALSATIQLSFNPVICTEYDTSIFNYVSDLEHLCGQEVDFYWNSHIIGSFVIKSIQFSGITDNTEIISGMNVSISMTEGYVRRENLETAVRTL